MLIEHLADMMIKILFELVLPSSPLVPLCTQLARMVTLETSGDV